MLKQSKVPADNADSGDPCMPVHLYVSGPHRMHSKPMHKAVPPAGRR